MRYFAFIEQHSIEPWIGVLEHKAGKLFTGHLQSLGKVFIPFWGYRVPSCLNRRYASWPNANQLT